MKDKPTALNRSNTLVLEPKECRIPNKAFIALYVIGITTMIALILSDVLNNSTTTGLITLTIVYGMLGGLLLFKKISIVQCPTRVLLGATAFIGITAFIDKYFI